MANTAQLATPAQQQLPEAFSLAAVELADTALRLELKGTPEQREAARELKRRALRLLDIALKLLGASEPSQLSA